MQRLVVVEISEARHIEARNPHIYHGDDAEVVLLTIAHFKPIDRTEAVVPHLVKVYVSNIESLSIALPRAVIALNEAAMVGAWLGRVGLPSRVAEVVREEYSPIRAV